jgi:hypothetical protein
MDFSIVEGKVTVGRLKREKDNARFEVVGEQTESEEFLAEDSRKGAPTPVFSSKSAQAVENKGREREKELQEKKSPQVEENKGEATKSRSHRDRPEMDSDRLEGDTPGQCGWLSKERGCRKSNS